MISDNATWNRRYLWHYWKRVFNNLQSQLDGETNWALPLRLGVRVGGYRTGELMAKKKESGLECRRITQKRAPKFLVDSC